MTRCKTIAILFVVAAIFLAAPVVSFGANDQVVIRQQDNGIVIRDAAEITVGGMFDLSGQTSRLCKPYVQGIEAAIRKINDTGGVSGAPFKLMVRDYAGDPDRVVPLYEELIKKHKVSVIQGWGAMDTVLLAPLISKDHVVYMSTWCRPDLADPRQSPYHFFISATFEDHARMAMKYAAENGAQRVCFIYPDLPFGRRPAEAGKVYAIEAGLTVGPDVIIGLRASQTVEDLEQLQTFDPEIVWLGGTAPSVAAILRDAARLDLHATFLVNAWGMAGGLARLTGENEQKRLLGLSVVRPSLSRDYDAGTGGGPVKSLSQKLLFDQGWAAMMVMREGLQRARQLGGTDGRKLRAALESLHNFETNGLTPPLTFSADDHRGTVSCGLYAIKDGVAELHSNLTLDR